MRILLDATSLLLRSAGVKTYMYYWIRSLQQAAVNDEIRLFPFLGRLSDLKHESSATGARSTALSLAALHFTNIRWNPIMELAGYSCDVFHASQHMRNPPQRTTRLTATIYDMTCWLMPEVHQASNIAATRQYGECVLLRADACIAISEQSKHDAMEILKIPDERIEVIYPGVAAEFFAADKAQASAAATALRLDKPYFLYVGMIEPRKNIDRLLDAYALLPERIRQNFDLVIAGPLGWHSEDTSVRLRSQQDGVKYVGYVAEELLPGLTTGATAFIFPSFYEGFGLPMAQALACGVPVIASHGSSLGEISANVTLPMDPHCTESISAAMEQVADSSSLQQTLGQLGRERAETFRWERNARQSLDFFHRMGPA